MQTIVAFANQRARCREVGKAADNGEHIAVIEAGTGTGKSLGALLPAMVMAKAVRPARRHEQHADSADS